MAQIRVHEIAKKLGLDNREVLLTLRAEGIPVASNLSLVDGSCVDLMKKALAKPKRKVIRSKRKMPLKIAAADLLPDNRDWTNRFHVRSASSNCSRRSVKGAGKTSHTMRAESRDSSWIVPGTR